MKTDCIFCAIGKGQAEASFVYRDETAFAIMDLNQPNPYKVLIIPYAHMENVYELDDATAASIFQATAKVARAVRDASGCAGMNLVQFNGRLGQQDIFHFHLHIIPRFADDNININWEIAHPDRATLDQLADDIRQYL